MVDLNKPINAEGLTLLDLVVTLVKECGKQGLFVGGAIIHPDNPAEARTFGAGSLETIHKILEIGADLTKDKTTVKQTEHFKTEAN